MITEEMLIKNTPKLYSYLKENFLVKRYLIGLNDVRLSGRSPMHRWDSIICGERNGISYAFTWITYSNTYNTGIDWAYHHNLYHAKYGKIRPWFKKNYNLMIL